MRTYRHPVKVHWGDLDPAKIVFYPNYFVWCKPDPDRPGELKAFAIPPEVRAAFE